MATHPVGARLMSHIQAPPHELAIVLGSGFRGHSVVIMLDGREAYRAANVVTNMASSQADTFVTITEERHVHVLVRVTPGDLVLSADCDVSTHTRVVISLIGKGSLWLETQSASPWSPA
jgi:hypothetical protein